MNSMSKPRDNDDSACGCKKEKEDAIVILKCKTGFPVTVTAEVNVNPTPTKLATFSLKTGHFCDPCIKFDFSNILTVTLGSDANSVVISYQLYKLCNGDSEDEVGPAWTITRGNVANEIITFIVCDCDCDCDKNDCCKYYVGVTYNFTTLPTTPEVITPTTITFNNPTLSALVVES